MKTLYKIFAPLFVLVLLAAGVVGVALAREASEIDGSSGEMEVVGTVDAVSISAWTIDGLVYQLTTATEIKDQIQPGALVKVHAYRDSRGDLTIREVELAGARSDDQGSSVGNHGADDSRSNSDHQSSGRDGSDDDRNDDSSGEDRDDRDDEAGDDRGSDDRDDDDRSSEDDRDGDDDRDSDDDDGDDDHGDDDDSDDDHGDDDHGDHDDDDDDDDDD